MEFKLRPWNPSDAESLAIHANHFEIAKYMTDAFPYPYTKEHANSFIQFAGSSMPVKIFAIEVERKAAGSIGIHPQPSNDIMRKNAELGYWLNPTYHNKGIVTNAIAEMILYAFEHFDINRIYARPFGNNPASQRVLEKAGFKLEGRFEKTILKNNEYLDELIYAFRKEE